MERFDVNILGCGSATPSPRHNTSSQIVNIREKLFMVDCGEGTQTQMRRARFAFAKVNHIFISHLHGDHCFGLLGVISTFGLLGRTSPLFIHAQPELWKILKMELDFYCSDLEYEVVFQEFDPAVRDVIYEDRSLTIESIPLRHRVPCTGFLFREKPVPDHLDRKAADYYGVPMWEFRRIKEGGDFVMPDGTVIPHSRLTVPGVPGRSYAYCCDTAYNPDMFGQIHGVNLLYHDCTYGNEEGMRAEKYFHSTAGQAAETAHKADVGQLLLGHFSARYEDESLLLEQARPIFPNSLLAKEGMQIKVL